MSGFEMQNKSLYEIHRIFRVHDGSGGWKKQYRKISEERGRIVLGSLTSRERARNDQDEGGRDRAEIRHVAYFRSGADIRKSDRIIDENGTIFEVLTRRVPSGVSQTAEFEVLEYQRGL
jgi:hypothetical protein